VRKQTESESRNRRRTRQQDDKANQKKLKDILMTDGFRDIEKLESDLWEAADNLRANSKLTSSDYFMPVLGVIFLRHAANRFEAAHRQIEEDKAAGRMLQLCKRFLHKFPGITISLS
jgi:type I restriction-modification system DNA methylase subunit